MTAETPTQRPERICMTTDECYQAGFDDGRRRKERMPPSKIDRMVALHGPFLRADEADDAA